MQGWKYAKRKDGEIKKKDGKIRRLEKMPLDNAGCARRSRSKVKPDPKIVADN